jgi:DNA-directed RNA polymerase beta' subunit
MKDPMNNDPSSTKFWFSPIISGITPSPNFIYMGGNITSAQEDLFSLESMEVSKGRAQIPIKTEKPIAGGIFFSEKHNNLKSDGFSKKEKNAGRSNCFDSKKQDKIDFSLVKSSDFVPQSHIPKKIYTCYSKLSQVKLVTIGLASPERIKQWAEKTLPNGKILGEVINANTLHHKTFKPQKGGLFCERIFGPLKDFECACGKPFKLKKEQKRLIQFTNLKQKHENNTFSTNSNNNQNLNLSSDSELSTYNDNSILNLNKSILGRSSVSLKNFCNICQVEYTWSVMRRYQLGYINLVSPITHVWYLKGNPSYLSILLDIKRRHLEYIIYCSEILTLENNLKGEGGGKSKSSDIVSSWKKLKKKILSNFEKKESGIQVINSNKLLESEKYNSDKNLVTKKLNKREKLKIKKLKSWKTFYSDFDFFSNSNQRNNLILEMQLDFLQDVPAWSVPSMLVPAWSVPSMQSQLLNYFAKTKNKEINLKVISANMNQKSYSASDNLSFSLITSFLNNYSSKLNFLNLKYLTLLIIKAKELNFSLKKILKRISISSYILLNLNILQNLNNINGLQENRNILFFSNSRVWHGACFTPPTPPYRWPYIYISPSIGVGGGWGDTSFQSPAVGKHDVASGTNREYMVETWPRQMAYLRSYGGHKKLDQSEWEKLRYKKDLDNNWKQLLQQNYKKTSLRTNKIYNKIYSLSKFFIIFSKRIHGRRKKQLKKQINLVKKTKSNQSNPRFEHMLFVYELFNNIITKMKKSFFQTNMRWYKKFEQVSKLRILKEQEEKTSNNMLIFNGKTYLSPELKNIFCSKNVELYTLSNFSNSISNFIGSNFWTKCSKKKDCFSGTGSTMYLSQKPIGIQNWIPRARRRGDNPLSGVGYLPLSRRGAPPKCRVNYNKKQKKKNLFNKFFQKILMSIFLKVFVAFSSNSILFKSTSRKKYYAQEFLTNSFPNLKTCSKKRFQKIKKNLINFYLVANFGHNWFSVSCERPHTPAWGGELPPVLPWGRRGGASLPIPPRREGMHRDWVPTQHRVRGGLEKQGGGSFYETQPEWEEGPANTTSKKNQVSKKFYEIGSFKSKLEKILYQESLYKPITKESENLILDHQHHYSLCHASFFLSNNFSLEKSPSLESSIIRMRHGVAAQTPLRHLKKLYNNVYCLSHRERWQTENDWNFLYYYITAQNVHNLSKMGEFETGRDKIFNTIISNQVNIYKIIPNYINNLKYLLKTSPNSQVGLSTCIYPVGVDAGTRNCPKTDQNWGDNTVGNGLDRMVNNSGPGVIQLLLSEFNFFEIKKMDKQNRILLYQLNKQILKLKKRLLPYSARQEGHSLDKRLLQPDALRGGSVGASAWSVPTMQALPLFPPPPGASPRGGRLENLYIPPLRGGIRRGGGVIKAPILGGGVTIHDDSSPIYGGEAETPTREISQGGSLHGAAEAMSGSRYEEREVTRVGIGGTCIYPYGVNAGTCVDGTDHAGTPSFSISHNQIDLLGVDKKNSKKELKECYKKRDLLIRRTKLVRKLFIKESSPQSIILTVLPVLPPDLRPIVKMGGQIAASDLNRLYQRVIYRNERLKKFLKDAATSNSYEMKYAQRLLQEAVDNLIQNGKTGGSGGAEKDSRGRALKSLSDILKGKQGRFRQYLLGKRVDYSGRSVIVVGPKLKLHECGIPKEMALELYLPFLLKRILNQNLARTVVGAKILIKTNPSLIWELLSEIMQTCPVLLNRAPTLHRLGIQAFQPKLIDGRAILLHPLVCSAFNADFDGDQMAVHVPITIEARTEAWKLMLSRNSILSPATGDPLAIPSQDMVLGCYYLTTTLTQVQINKLKSVESLTIKKSASYTNFFKIKSSAPSINPPHPPYGGGTKLTRVGRLDREDEGHTNISSSTTGLIYGFYFSKIESVIKAYELKKIELHTNIWLKWIISGLIENGSDQEEPTELRLDSFGNWKEIYTKSQKRYNSRNQCLVHYILTTPGKIIFNLAIQKAASI